MFYYLDFQTGPDDLFYRITFRLESMRRSGWLHLRMVQHQLEGSAPEHVEDPKIYKARNCARREEVYMACSCFSDRSWLFDLTPWPVLPDLADIPGS